MPVEIKFESDRVEERVEGVRRSAPSGKFGFPPVDDLIQGIHPATFVTLAGIPGSSKTTLINFLFDKAAAEGYVCVILALDGASQYWLNKSFARLGSESFTTESFYRPEMADELRAVAKRYGETIGRNVVYIDEPISSLDLVRHIGEIQNSRPGQKMLLAVDYIQLWNPAPDDHRVKDARAIVQNGVAALCQIAHAYSITVFAISSVSRSSYKKQGIDCMCESNALEYGADVALKISLEAEPDQNGNGVWAEGTRVAHLSLLKSRFPFHPETTFRFDPRKATFLEN